MTRILLALLLVLCATQEVSAHSYDEWCRKNWWLDTEYCRHWRMMSMPQQTFKATPKKLPNYYGAAPKWNSPLAQQAQPPVDRRFPQVPKKAPAPQKKSR